MKRKRRCPLHNIENDLPKQVQTKGAAPLRDRLADAVDLIIRPLDEVAAILGDFIPQAHAQPGASPVSSIKLITERASTTTHVLYEIHEIHGQRYEAHSHWGLNE
jgi:hypothetical protein